MPLVVFTWPGGDQYTPWSVHQSFVLSTSRCLVSSDINHLVLSVFEHYKQDDTISTAYDDS